ncbi:transcriptional regulator [Actinokineospora inagensis]|uniref:transcriptional regulator n=1 Tax=Actinokineospora inagensis TaxID=103730 RepID=UPI0004051BF8|nr:transcriptional regulator [Actinokineospora inagensis]
MAPGHRGHGPGDTEGLLDVAPEAVPTLRAAFADARDRVDQQLALGTTGLLVEPWAQDPVSLVAADGVNRLTAGGDRAVLDALTTYRAQLDTAVHTLDQVAEQYRLLEEDNEATVTQRGSEGGYGG